MPTISRILVPVKKPDAKILPAVEKAEQLALAFGAGIELFNATARPIYTGRVGRGIGVGEQVANTHRLRTKSRLEAIAGPIRKRGVTVHTHAGWDSPPAEAIVRRAARIKGDLIVSECHADEHRGAWLLRLTDRKLLLLSAVPLLLVKSKRLYSIRCDVLVVKPPGFAGPVGRSSQKK